MKSARTESHRWQREMHQLQQAFIDLKRQSSLQERFFEVARTNPRLKHNPFPLCIKMWYGYYSSICIRRLCDRDKNAVSLVRLLVEIGSARELRTVFGGKLDKAGLVRDIAAILMITKREKDFVDQAIAHTDRRRTDRLKDPTFNDVRRTVDALEPIVRRYCDLFNLHVPLDPKLPPDWDEVFAFPWAVS